MLGDQQTTKATKMIRKGKTWLALSKTRNLFGRGIQRILQRDTLSDDGQIWDEIEETLLGADIGITFSETLIRSVKGTVSASKIVQPSEIINCLREEMISLLNSRDLSKSNLTGASNTVDKPLVLLVVGVNGVGKTTSIAKLAFQYVQSGKTVLLAAADTFRAAAADQLKRWGELIDVPVVAHQHGADPGAVAYDAYQAAASRGYDVLIVDTAGRMHSTEPLMAELMKIRNVLQKQNSTLPHQTLLVLDATIGVNGLSQAKVFQEKIGATGVFLSKIDGTAKGGIIIPIVCDLGLPVMFVGTGEELEDIAIFDKQDFVDGLLSSHSIED